VSGATSDGARRLFRRGARWLDRLVGDADWKHAALKPAVLQCAMPARLAAARYGAGPAGARERERRFLEASTSYREAMADNRPDARQTTATTIDGLTWWVPLTRPDDAHAIERSLGHQNFPYRAITQTRELGIGRIMLDIGGNTGRTAIPRVVLGDVRAAYCAEPDPLNYACLVRNIRDNGLRGLVMPDRVAIGAENAVGRLLRAKSAGGHKLIDPGVHVAGDAIEVSCLTLDTWCERLGVDPREVSFVKVDAQGSEAHVLRGASRLLQMRHVAWQIEIDLALLAERGSEAALFGLLQQHFTHWIDLNRRATGPRLQRISQLEARLGYLRARRRGRTDILAFSLDLSPKVTS